MEEVKIQYLKAEYTFMPTSSARCDEDDAEHLHINRKSIEFTKVGGIDSFGEDNMGVVPHTITGWDYGSNTIGGLVTYSCAPPRASKGVESSLYSSVPPVNQWLDSYQRSIREMRELREFDKEIREQGKSGDINESYRRTE